MLILGIILGLFVLVVLVVLHELGHAIVARRNGVVVEEFGIGFPPRAWAKKLKNGILFTVNYLPLGGFVKLQGEHDAADKKGDYGAATYWQKTRILFAGVVVNLVTAAVILSVLAATGLPKIIPDQFVVAEDTTYINQPLIISQVIDGYPAKSAGLQQGDRLISVDAQAVATSEKFVSVTRENRGQTVEVVYERDGERRDVDVPLRDQDSGVFGANIGQQQYTRSTWSAPIVGFVTTGQFIIATFQGLGDLLANLGTGFFEQFSSNQATRDTAGQKLETVKQSVAGPVGILGIIFPAAGEAGLTQVLFLAAIISLSLGVMNALPIPALDGGRWFVMTIYKLRKKPLTKEREETIQATGFLVLMGLIVVITIADVSKFF